MSAAKPNADCWPTRQQELLLRAALLQGKNSIESWDRWKSCVDFDHLDTGSHRLLSLVYFNLHAQGIKDPLVESLKAIYLRTWRENELLFHHVSRLLSAFRDAGIETIILKGAALALLHYQDCGLRPMNDFDVMVHVGQRPAAINLMGKLGWTPIPRSPEALTAAYLSIVNSHGFTHSAGRECDLHWHLFPECCQADADDDFWQQAVPFRVHDVLTLSLAPTDQLLHVCVHGAEWNPIPPLRWVADAMMIMKTAPIDWDRLIAQARKRRLILPLRDTLDYLHDRLAAAVPPEILQSLHNLPASRLELAEYKVKTENYETKPLGYLPVLWFRYLRSESNAPARPRFFGFVKYLQRFWGAEHIGQWPYYAALMAMRRIRLMARVTVQAVGKYGPAKTAIQQQASGREIDE